MRKCPVCGELLEDCADVYRDKQDNIVGCEYCLVPVLAYTQLPEFDEEQAQQDYIDNRLWEQAKDERWGI